MTATTVEKTTAYQQKIEAMLAKGSPVRIFDQYEKFKVARR